MRRHRTREPSPVHDIFIKHSARTAKCDVCARNNKDKFDRCVVCGMQICTPCLARLGGDARHTSSGGFLALQSMPVSSVNEWHAINQETGAEDEVVLGAEDTDVQEPNNVEEERGIPSTHTAEASRRICFTTERDEKSHDDMSKGRSSKQGSGRRQQRPKAEDGEGCDAVPKEGLDGQMSTTRQQNKRAAVESDVDVSEARPRKRVRFIKQQKERAVDEESDDEPLVMVRSRRSSMRRPQKKRKMPTIEEIPRVTRNTRRAKETRAAEKVKFLNNRLLPKVTDHFQAYSKATIDYLLYLAAETDDDEVRTTESADNGSGLLLLLDAAAEVENPRAEPVSVGHRDVSSAEAVAMNRIPGSDINGGESRHPNSALSGTVSTTGFSASYAKEGEASRMDRSASKEATTQRSTDTKMEGREDVRHPSPLFFDYEPTTKAREHSPTGIIPIDTRTAVRVVTASTTDTTSDEAVKVGLSYTCSNCGSATGIERLRALYRENLLVKTIKGKLRPLRL